MDPALPSPVSSSSVPAGCALPPSGPEHAWLERFVGRWESEIEVEIGGGQSPLRAHGCEDARMLGGAWLVAEGRNLSFPYTFQLCLGYDSRARVYVGTWIDSMSPFLWRYRGNVDRDGTRLTLETEGPFPGGGKRHARFREVTQFLSADHRLFTSERMNDSGAWQRCLRIEFRRGR